MNTLLMQAGILMFSLLLSACNTQQEPPVEIQPTPEISVPETSKPENTSPTPSVTPEITPENNGMITEAEAKAIALQHANVAEADVTFVKTNFEYDNNIPEFEVEFYVGNMEYDYEINALTGEIRSFDQEMESQRPPTTTTPSTTMITEAEAKAIALQHANVTEADATFVKAKFEYDDTIPEFEVEFYVGNMEYDYEINALTGEIRSFDQEMEAQRPSTPSTSTSVITEAEAKQVALSHAGFTESEVSRLKVEFDYDDGLPEYEVEFYVGNTEYDYEINGNTGEIKSFDKDFD